MEKVEKRNRMRKALEMEVQMKMIEKKIEFQRLWKKIGIRAVVKPGTGVAALQEMKGAENGRGVTDDIKAGEAALQIATPPTIPINTALGLEKTIRVRLGRRVEAVESIRSTGNTGERILPVDHIVALIMRNEKRGRINTTNDKEIVES